jgi:hypothetical protein
MPEKKKRSSTTKPPKPINFKFWAPVLIVAGLIIGFALCYFTFVYYGGN